MFKNLVLSAPGKIILCGEHAVVYGKKALASAIDLRTTFNATYDANLNDRFEIKYPSLKKTFSITQSEFDLIQQECHNDLNELVAYLSENNSNYESKPISAIKLMLISLKQSLKWSMLSGLCVLIETQIPIGSGLGSSASFAVCLAGFFLILADQISTQLDLNDLELINKYAFNIEKLFHGTPSGVDNTVAAYGNYLVFRKGSTNETFKSDKELQIIVIDSKMPKKTLEQVAKVRQLYDRHTVIVEHLLDAVESLSTKFVEILKENQSFSSLNDLISINQGLLMSLQVSNYELNTIVNLCQSYGFSAKITGAGGGGCCYVLVDEANSNMYDSKLKLLDKLKENNFEPFQVCLGAKGIQIDRVDLN